jgi:2-polyprenyl-3-methyl-5-hydroxy-6-metoxy-1,4-benzoquinol methylase
MRERYTRLPLGGIRCPVQEELIDRYGDQYLDYEIENEQPFFELMQKALSDVSFLSQARSRGFLNGRLLDIGCATGVLIEHYSRAGWKAEGIEVCLPSARYGMEKRNVPIKTVTFEEAGYPGGSFDVIHASHLIEHLADPRAFMSEAHRVLTEHGLLVLTTPNAAGAQARLLGKRWRSVIPDHIHLFSRKNLTRLLKANGFRPVAARTWGGVARGLLPDALKNPLDRLAKKYGAGDVMVILSERV